MSRQNESGYANLKQKVNGKAASNWSKAQFCYLDV